MLTVGGKGGWSIRLLRLRKGKKKIYAKKTVAGEEGDQFDTPWGKERKKEIFVGGKAAPTMLKRRKEALGKE